MRGRNRKLVKYSMLFDRSNKRVESSQCMPGSVLALLMVLAHGTFTGIVNPHLDVRKVSFREVKLPAKHCTAS